MNKKILIADDHSVVRLGTKIVLQRNIDELEIDFAENYDQVKEKIKAGNFDLLILDIEMENSIYKYMIKELKSIQQDLKILVFSSSEENIGLDYVQEGAEGYLNKLNNDEVLVKAVTSIFEEGYYYPPKLVQLSGRPQRKDPQEVLSERELQVFKLLGEGNGSLEIANALNVQAGTVGTYKKRIYNKLGIKNIIDLFKVYRKLD